MFGSVRSDVRFAARQILRNRVYATVAILSLAVGIGAPTTIFTVVNALLLRPRPGIDERALVDVGRTQNGAGFDNFSYPNFLTCRDASRSVLADLAAYDLEPRPLSLSVGDTAVRIYGQTVSGNYFDVLAVRPQVGRFFGTSEDEATGRDLLAVASDRFWRGQLGASRQAVGRPLVLNGQAFTLVGVAPPGFTGTMMLGADVWTPIHATVSRSQLESRRSVWLLGVGRLRPGASVAQARAALGTIARRLEHDYPAENEGQGFDVLPSSRVPAEIGTAVTSFLALLLALAGLILLVTCVNVGGMTLARATARRREIAIRLAIGAGRRDLVRQLVTEVGLLFVLGGAAGVLLAVWLRGLLVALIPHLPVPIVLGLPFDVRVLAFAFAITVVAGLLTGLTPALQASRVELVGGLKDASLFDRPPLRTRHTLLALQVALSMLLVVMAGLMARTLEDAGRIDPGFDPSDVEIASFDVSLARLDEASGRAFAEALLARVNALATVRSASLAVDLPLDGGGFGLGGVQPADHALPDDRPLSPDWNVVTPSFHRTMRIPMVAGRPFDDRDRAGAPSVAIVNQTLGSRLWPGENPIGKRLINETSSGPVAMEVVGVERNLKYRSLGEAPRSFIYVPLAQRWLGRLTLVVRRSGRTSVIPDIRAIVHQLNPYLPITDAQSLDEYISLGLVPQRIALAVAGSLGTVGLLLAGIGIYGITAYSVARRTREIGLRMALGAGRLDVVGEVVCRTLVPGATGVAVGGALAAGGAYLVRSLLYGSGPSDPVTYITAAALFVLVMIVASYAPARRAIRIDPASALRDE